MSQSNYKVDDRVRWKWGESWAYGHIKERYTEKVTKTLKGNRVTRNASDDEPAYLIEQKDGDRVLKSHSELHKA